MQRENNQCDTLIDSAWEKNTVGQKSAHVRVAKEKYDHIILY